MHTHYQLLLQKIFQITKRSLFISGIFFFLLITSPAQADTFLTDLNNHKISFQHLKGKWILINYWANWCQPCVNEIGVFNQFYERYHQQVAVFAVHYDPLSRKQIEALVHKYQIHYPHLQNNPAKELHLGHISSVPTTFVFNPEGELVQTLHGPQSLSALKRASFLSKAQQHKFAF